MELTEPNMTHFYETRQDYGMKPAYDFIHFKTPDECETYRINNKNLIVVYKCCGGTGIAIARKNIVYNPFIPIQGTCDICFGEEISLYNIRKGLIRA